MNKTQMIDVLVEAALNDQGKLLVLIDEVLGNTVGDWLASQLETLPENRVEVIYETVLL